MPFVTIEFSEQKFDSAASFVPGGAWVLGRIFDFELRPLINSLRQEESMHATRGMESESVESVGLTTSLSIILLSKEVVVDLAKVAIPALFTFLAGWLARSSRSVQIKVGDIELKAENEEQAEAAVADRQRD